MTAVTEDRRSARARAERQAIDNLIRRLQEQFPELSPDEIVAAVHGRYEAHDDSRVRDFVPILVERSARAQLAAAPRHRA